MRFLQYQEYALFLAIYFLKTDREFQDVYLCLQSFTPEELSPEKEEVDAFRAASAEEILEGMKFPEPSIVPHGDEFRRLLQEI